jgi:hypothetical protein
MPVVFLFVSLCGGSPLRDRFFCFLSYNFLVSILNWLPTQDDRLKELEKQELRINCC